jgi:hypothetical protein
MFVCVCARACVCVCVCVCKARLLDSYSYVSEILIYRLMSVREMHYSSLLLHLAQPFPSVPFSSILPILSIFLSLTHLWLINTYMKISLLSVVDYGDNTLSNLYNLFMHDTSYGITMFLVSCLFFIVYHNYARNLLFVPTARQSVCRLFFTDAPLCLLLHSLFFSLLFLCCSSTYISGSHE